MDFGRARLLPSRATATPNPERLGGSLALSDNDQRGWFAASAVDLGATKRGGLVWSASSQVLR